MSTTSHSANNVTYVTLPHLNKQAPFWVVQVCFKCAARPQEWIEIDTRQGSHYHLCPTDGSIVSFQLPYRSNRGFYQSQYVVQEPSTTCQLIALTGPVASIGQMTFQPEQAVNVEI